MRIIDKNRDYYDYLQSPDDNRIVFDRRGSIILTRKMLCSKMRNVRYYEKLPIRFLLMQCGCNFWLFLAEITEKDSFGLPEDYNLELLTYWKDYKKKRKIIELNSISLRIPFFGPWVKITKEDVVKNVDVLKNEIIQGNFSAEFNPKDQPIPILKECGIASLVNAQEIFVAIEEYFSMEKTESETTEPKGATNDDKIIMHGFDIKTSFRGKR